MLFLTKLILEFFDKFTQDKVFKFIKTVIDNKINILLDVGSHKGEYIVNITKSFSVNRIFGFEPNPKIYQILLNKTKEMQNIEVLNCAIGESDGTSILNENIESSSSSINKLNEKSKYFKRTYFFFNFLNKKDYFKPIEIEILSLENFIKSKKIDFIDLLKIDTEGYEFNVLKGLGNKINKVKLIHLEHHFDDMVLKNYKLSDIHNYLIQNNFKKVFKVKMKFRKSFEYIYLNILLKNK